MDTLTTIITLALQLQHLPAVVGPDTCTNEPRTCAIAHDIVATVESAEALPYVGDAAGTASAVALLSIAHHESGLKQNVQDCTLCNAALIDGSRWCDRGRSISMYQLMVGNAWGGYARTDICSDNKLATKLALNLLVRFKGPAMFRTYAGCRTIGCGAANRLASQAEVLFRKAGLRVIGTTAVSMRDEPRKG